MWLQLGFLRRCRRLQWFQSRGFQGVGGASTMADGGPSQSSCGPLPLSDSILGRSCEDVIG